MSQNSTIFISGFSLGVNENDNILLLELIDSVQEDYKGTYSFALPAGVSKQLFESLKVIYEEVKDDGNTTQTTEEENVRK